MPSGRRVTRPLRAAGRLVRVARPRKSVKTAARPGQYDSWLEHSHDDVLAPIDEACADGGPERFALFRVFDAELWALLLTQEFEASPNIRALLPAVPDASLQEVWNGVSGAPLAAQGKAFYLKLRERFGRPLSGARVVDFGCGWGRLTRFLARDVEAGDLYGCDPVEGILEVCRECRVPATLARSEFVPERLPFDAPFDLAFAFSVFTHISEPAHEACLRALHASLRPGGTLVLTVRPPRYLEHSERLHPLLESLGHDPGRALREPRYLFVPHPAEPTHLQHEGGEMTYGETVVTLPYIRERWSPLFEPVAIDLLLEDPYQVMVTLQKRGS